MDNFSPLVTVLLFKTHRSFFTAIMPNKSGQIDNKEPASEQLANYENRKW